MLAQETEDMFNFRYEKTAAEIIDKAEEKTTALNAKIEEREARVTRVREQHKIDDAAMAQLYEARHRQGVQAVAYSFSNSAVGGGQNRMEERTIEAGVVNGIFTEKDAIAADKATVKKLNTIVRNLRPLSRINVDSKPYKDDNFQLSEQELEFLGF